MASVIDPTKPEDGVPANKAELRANLEAAKTELDHGGFAEGFTPAQYGSPASARVRDHLAAIDAALGGLGSFTGLADTPSVYATHGSRFVKVKADETGLEFANAPGGSGGLTGYTDVKADHISAAGDGTTDDTTALQAALNSGAAVVYLPPGTYRITSPLSVIPGTTVIGAGPGQTIIDATGLPSQHDPAAISCTGTTVTLPTLSNTLSEGDHQLSFSSSVAADVRENDVIGIRDTRDSSWTSRSVTDLDGGYITVLAVNGSTVVCASGVPRTLPSTRIPGGTVNDLQVVRLDRRGVTFRDFTLDCSGLGSWPDGTSPNGTGLGIRLVADPVVENVHVRGARTYGMNIDRCGRPRIRGCMVMNLNSGWVNADGLYGIICQGCCFGTFDRCYILAARHAFDYAKGDAGATLGWIPGHDNLISHCVLETPSDNAFVAPGSGYTITMNWHEGCYRCHVQDSIIINGVGPRGWGHVIKGNYILRHPTDSNAAVLNVDNMGPRFELVIRDNVIITFTGVEPPLRLRWDYMESGEGVGFCDISGNVIDVRASTTQPVISFEGGVPSGKAHAKIHDNLVIGGNPSFIALASGAGDYARVTVLNNQLPSGMGFGTIANTVDWIGMNVIGGNIEFDNLPTASPGGSGRLWNDAGTLKIT